MASKETGPGDTVVIRAVGRDEEGQKRVDKFEVPSHDPDTLRYVQKKMIDKGVQRLERHPAHRSVAGPGHGRQPQKAGHGGKFTWEGPLDIADAEFDPAPAALDEGDPNYVDEEVEERLLKQNSGPPAAVIGEVEVPKASEINEGHAMSRIDVQPELLQPQPQT